LKSGCCPAREAFSEVGSFLTEGRASSFPNQRRGRRRRHRRRPGDRPSFSAGCCSLRHGWQAGIRPVHCEFRVRQEGRVSSRDRRLPPGQARIGGILRRSCESVALWQAYRFRHSSPARGGCWPLCSPLRGSRFRVRTATHPYQWRRAVPPRCRRQARSAVSRRAAWAVMRRFCLHDRARLQRGARGRSRLGRRQSAAPEGRKCRARIRAFPPLPSGSGRLAFLPCCARFPGGGRDGLLPSPATMAARPWQAAGRRQAVGLRRKKMSRCGRHARNARCRRDGRERKGRGRRTTLWLSPLRRGERPFRGKPGLLGSRQAGLPTDEPKKERGYAARRSEYRLRSDCPPLPRPCKSRRLLRRGCPGRRARRRKRMRG
jgi:hypothetical protein